MPMGKTPGRVERTIETAFKANPDGYFSVGDLARLAYPDSYKKLDRSKIQRAAHNVAKRLHWVMFRSQAHPWEAIFANSLSLRSYGLGQVRARLGDEGVHDYTRGPDGTLVKGRWMTSAERVMDRLETDEYYVKRMKPGGEFALAVEYHTAVANGETERAAELDAVIKQQHEAEQQAMIAAPKALRR